MQTFIEWLDEPQNEGLFRNLVTAGLIGAAGLGAGTSYGASPTNVARPQVQQIQEPNLLVPQGGSYSIGNFKLSAKQYSDLLRMQDQFSRTKDYKSLSAAYKQFRQQNGVKNATFDNLMQNWLKFPQSRLAALQKAKQAQPQVRPQTPARVQPVQQVSPPKTPSGSVMGGDVSDNF
jgi:hypothetical protein